MKVAVLVGWLARLAAMGLSLLNIRLLADLTGTSGLAAHAIFTSLAMWMALLSFGIPSGMQNLTSEWRAEGRSLERLRDSVASLTILGCVVLLPVAALIGLLAKHFFLARYPFLSTWAVVAGSGLLLLSSLGSVFTQMLHAEHRSVWPNLYPACVSLAVFAALVVLKGLPAVEFDTVLILYFLPAAAVVGAAALQLRVPSKWFLDWGCLAVVWQRSRGYLLASFLGTLTLGIDYAILSQVLDAQDVAAYSLSGRLFLLVLTIHAVLLASAWTPIGDRYYQRDYAGVRTFLVKLLGTGLALGLLAGAIILIALPDLMSLLAGANAPRVSLLLALLWWAYLMVRVWSDTFFVVMQSFGKADLLNRYIPVQAGLSVIGQLWLGSLYGAEGVLAGIILSFLLTCAWYLPRHTLALIRPPANIES
jgi:O-antigen/teichoic acid export membrane protein